MAPIPISFKITIFLHVLICFVFLKIVYGDCSITEYPYDYHTVLIKICVIISINVDFYLWCTGFRI